MGTQHFRLLDGLRGLAAVVVVIYHFRGRSDLGEAMPHGYLAVDFFFVLSGLVVGHAYRRRLQGLMTTAQFLRRRWIRLWPMIVPGTVLAAALELWRPESANGHLADAGLLMLLGCFALPWPFHTALEQTIFPLNGPVWSLFFEIVASIVFVAIIKRPRIDWSVAGLIGVGALGLCGYLVTTGTVDTGPYVDNWVGGFARVSFSFFVGVAIDPIRRHVPAVGAWVYAAVLLAIFMVPHGSGLAKPWFEAAIVFAVFPVLVASASNCEAGALLTRLCALSGEISYPLYALHYPVIRVICFVMNRQTVPLWGQAAICVGAVVATSCISLAVSRLYDQPVRQFLTRMFDQSPPRAAKPGWLSLGGAKSPPTPEVG